MRYLTYTCQKDGRYTLGTVIHKEYSCIYDTSKGKIMKVTGEILNIIPKCKKCFRRKK
jgi:hypothetical protein